MAVVSLTGKKRDDYEERDQLVQIGKNQFVTKPGSQSRGKATAEVTPDQYLDRLAEYGLTDTAYQRSGTSPYTGNGGKPGYSSRYSSQIDALLDSVLNREGFSYDVESDPLYQQYRKQYIREGDRAMRDTMGNAAALTGGYGSSYGTTAGSQAYDYYLSQLNDRVPELEQLAYQKYQDEGTALLNRLSALQAMEDQDYSRYRDQMNDYYNDRTFDYQKEQDALSQKNWQAQFDYQKEQDTLSQKNWLNYRAFSQTDRRKETPMETIEILSPGHPLWDRTARFAETCSWQAGPILAKKMRENDFEENERVLVLLCDGDIAAFCTYANKDELPPELDFGPFAGFVFTAEAYRGRRFSQRLIDAACALARAQGFPALYVMSGEVGLYEKFGFRKIGDYPTIYHTVDQLFCKEL